MPILQGAQEVHIDRCDFRDIKGNYYDYAPATSKQPANGSDDFKIGGQFNQTSKSWPAGHQISNGFDNPALRDILDRNPAAVSEAFFSKPGGSAVNSLPSSQSSQNRLFDNNQYGNAAGAVPEHLLASPQTPQGVPAGGRNTNAAPARNVSFPPNPTASAPGESKANDRIDSIDISDLSYTANYGTNVLNTEPWTTIFPTPPTGRHNDSQHLQFRLPNNVNSTAPPFYIRNASTLSSQSSDITNASTLSSPSPDNANASTGSSQHLFRNVPVSKMPGEATQGERAPNSSILPDRSTSQSPGRMSPEQGTPALPANARASAATNNEALANASLEKGAGFLGF